MKFSGILLALLSSSVTHRAAADGVCCLCDNCENPAKDKLDMVLLGLPDDELMTCLDLANHLEIVVPTEDSSVQCLALRKQYSKACCTEGDLDLVMLQEEENEIVDGEEESFLRRAARHLWQVSTWTATSGTTGETAVVTTASSNAGSGNAYGHGRSYQRYEPQSTSVKCSDHPYTSNSVTFATPGGACECPVCKSGEEPEGWFGGSMFVPGRGQYSGPCKYLNDIGTCSNACSLCV